MAAIDDRGDARHDADELVVAVSAAGLGDVVVHETGDGPASLLKARGVAEVARAVALAARLHVRVAVTQRVRTGLLALDLEKIHELQAPDEVACLIRVGAGAKVGDVEDRAIQAGLTLGPLLPSTGHKKVGAWLAGPTRGERAIPGDRLETAALALEAVLADGSLYRSKEVPRSATGPDLDHLLLGGEGRFGIITHATLRLFPRGLSEASGARAAVTLLDAVEAVRAAVSEGLSPAEARWERVRAAVEVRFTGHLAAQRARRFGTVPLGGREGWGHLELAGSWRAWAAASPLRPQSVQFVAIHGDGAFGALRFDDPAEAERAAKHAQAIGLVVVSPRRLRAPSDAAIQAAGAGAVYEALLRAADRTGVLGR